MHVALWWLAGVSLLGTAVCLMRPGHVAIGSDLPVLRFGLRHPRLSGIHVGARHFEVVSALVVKLLGNQAVLQELLGALKIFIGPIEVGSRRR